MSNKVNPIMMRTANKKQQHMPRHYTHVGSSDFFQAQVVHCQKVVAGQHVDLHVKVGMNARPLALPSSIEIKHSLRAFWVPGYCAHKNWFAFRTNVPFFLNESIGYGKVEDDYYFYNTDMVKLFFLNATGQGNSDFLDLANALWYTAADVNNQTTMDAARAAFDFVITYFNSSNNTLLGGLGVTLTNRGRLLKKTFESLGYEIAWQLGTTSSVTDETTAIAAALTASAMTSRERKRSARPLMSLIKILLDYYLPPQYTMYYEGNWEAALNYTHFNIGQAPGGQRTLVELINYICYDVDRFNGAWKNPTGPNNETSQFDIKDITISSASARSAVESGQQGNNGTSTNTPQIVGLNSGNYGPNNYRITDYILRALNAVQNYTTRNRIAGYRPIDRFLAHFGVHLNYIHTKRSQYIKGEHRAMKVAPIESTIQQNIQTGSLNPKDIEYQKYALGGKGGTMNGAIGLDLKFKAEDDGFIIVIDTMVTGDGYYQGIKNHCLQVNWRDQYNPEFDNLGTTAISRSEVFVNHNGSPNLFNDEDIWGFEPTYLAMKTGYDTISGDLRNGTLNTGMDAMFSMRMFEPDGSNVPQTIQSSFLKGTNTDYARYFEYDGDDVDHFNFVAIVSDNGTMPMESVSESLPLTDGEGGKAEFNYGGGNYLN